MLSSLYIQTYHPTCTNRTFIMVAPSFWSVLPDGVKQTDSMSLVDSRLKNYQRMAEQTGQQQLLCHCYYYYCTCCLPFLQMLLLCSLFPPSSQCTHVYIMFWQTLPSPSWSLLLLLLIPELFLFVLSIIRLDYNGFSLPSNSLFLRYYSR